MTKQKLKLYYVEGGDTLYKIAKRFNTREQEILKFNKPWLSNISPGLKLWVPDNRIGTEISSVTDDIAAEEKILGREAIIKVMESDIESIEISPKKIFYMEDSIPDYVTIKIKTNMPTSGDMTIIGNSQIEKITLSEGMFKMEHIIFWAPVMNQTKQSLPPGEYILKFNLYKQK
jgi:hypothetical protein